MKLLYKLLTGFGIFLLIGTAGASDINYIAVKQIFIQLIISIIIISLGISGIMRISHKEETRKRYALKNI